jgi:hypothetical protein
MIFPLSQWYHWEIDSFGTIRFQCNLPTRGSHAGHTVEAHIVNTFYVDFSLQSDLNHNRL